MKCPACGGALVWDEEEGYVVCSSCGLVVDRIYEEKHTRIREDETTSAGKKKGSWRRVISPEYRERLRLYEKSFRMIKKKPWFEVDYGKVFAEKRFVETLISKASKEAIENISRLEYWGLVKKGLLVIESTNPAFLSRSIRGKYALAYLVAHILEKNDEPDVDEFTKIFNMSTSSYVRLRKTAWQIVKQYYDSAAAEKALKI